MRDLFKHAAMLIAIVLIATFLTWLSSDKRIDQLPQNVEYSTVAVSRLESCLTDSANAGYYGSLSVYPNNMIECLYAAGLTLEYNGEPVRREITPNE